MHASRHRALASWKWQVFREQIAGLESQGPLGAEPFQATGAFQMSGSLESWWPDDVEAGHGGKDGCRNNMREDCVWIIGLLEETPAAEWAEAFVVHKCSFWRKSSVLSGRPGQHDGGRPPRDCVPG
jgi:hypothetical protein